MIKSKAGLAVSLLAVLSGCGGSPSSDAESADPNEQAGALSVDDKVTLQEFARNGPLSLPLVKACPAERSDELCTALRTAEASGGADVAIAYDRARSATKKIVQSKSAGEALADPAVSFFLRERIHALHAFNVATNFGATPESADYKTRVDAALSQSYSLYDPSSFRMAHAYLPPALPSTACAKPEAALVIFPGVLRSPTALEFEEQAKKVEELIPCLKVVRVPSGSVVGIDENAADAKKLIDELDAEIGPVPLHFLGYSQGASNALAALVNYPELAGRVRTQLSMNSAARGSEVADFILNLLKLYEEQPDAGCGSLWPIARGFCEKAANASLKPIASTLQKIFDAQGVSFDDLNDYNLGDWLKRRVEGGRSLSTGHRQRWFDENGSKLPKDTAYFAFRSVITDEDKHLPGSNWFFYQVIWRAARNNMPYSDMQVRLVNEQVGGPVEDRECVSRVADGNHWAWELSSAGVGESYMPKAMFDLAHRNELFAAYYESFAEVGLLFKKE